LPLPRLAEHAGGQTVRRPVPSGLKPRLSAAKGKATGAAPPQVKALEMKGAKLKSASRVRVPTAATDVRLQLPSRPSAPRPVLGAHVASAPVREVPGPVVSHDSKARVVEVVAGTGEEGIRDGALSACQMRFSTALCRYGDLLFVAHWNCTIGAVEGVWGVADPLANSRPFRCFPKSSRD
jgi:hypothetical protein